MEKEVDEVTIEGELKLKKDKIIACCLMGEILSSTQINNKAFKVAINEIWRTVQGVKVGSLGINKFIFFFTSEID